MARRTVFVRKYRINGPRKSRVRVGLTPFIAFLALVALTALIGLKVVTDPELEDRIQSGAKLRSTELEAPKQHPWQNRRPDR